MIKLLTDENIEYFHIEKLGGRREKTDLVIGKTRASKLMLLT
jgi:hypothetical protein